MARAGRRPKPSAIKRLEGNPGKRPINMREPKPDKKAPPCPKWLDPEAKKEWRRLSKKLEEWAQDGRRLVLVIGGSLGLSEAVLRRADEKLSFSNLTFPHGLMRVILLEQLYRAERIRTGERYHK